jgi:hypothetical protein
MRTNEKSKYQRKKEKQLSGVVVERIDLPQGNCITINSFKIDT